MGEHTPPPFSEVRTHIFPTNSGPVNTKQLYNICTILHQHRRRCVGDAQMLYIYFVFAGISELFDLNRTTEKIIYMYILLLNYMVARVMVAKKDTWKSVET